MTDFDVTVAEFKMVIYAFVSLGFFISLGIILLSLPLVSTPTALGILQVS